MLLSTHVGRAVAPFYGLSVCYSIYPIAPGRLIEVYRRSKLRNHGVLLVLVAIWRGFLAGSYAQETLLFTERKDSV